MVALFINASSLSACGGCGSGALAELLEAHGTVDRDLAASVGQWTSAAPGASFQAGDGLRTAQDATALVRVGRKGRVHVDSDTTIRFSRNRDAKQDAPPALEVEQGTARVVAGEEQLTLQTQLGRAVLAAGGSMTVARAENGTRYRVLVGGATFDGNDGSAKQLGQGDSIMIGLGTAVLEAMPDKEEARAAPKAAAAPAATGDAGTPPQAADAVDAALSVSALVKGEVRRRGADDETWSPLAQGLSQLGVDDELEVGASAQASLQRGRERAVLGTGRYQVGAIDAPLVRAIDGNVQIEASEGQSVRIAVPGGTITAVAVEGGTRANVEVRAKDGHTAIQVERGQVKASNEATQLSLKQGEHGELAVPAHASAAQPSAAPERPELVVSAGEFFRVYDPKPPTAIGFKVGKACGERIAELRIEGLSPVRGTEQINVAVGPGMHDYAVHCLDGDVPAPKPAVRSMLRIVRNDGARRLAMTPPKNDVSVDGRRYTLMYQNLKPVLTARWRDAPAAPGYVLHVTPPRGATLSLRASQPQYVVPANALKDGLHHVQFETTGKTKVSSKDTLVDVMFDNAAPTASLELPPAAGFARAGNVTVAGVVVEGSRVSVGTKQLALDAQQRFRDDVVLHGEERAIVVRVQHPRHGIRYYLRRVIR